LIYILMRGIRTY